MARAFLQSYLDGVRERPATHEPEVLLVARPRRGNMIAARAVVVGALACVACRKDMPVASRPVAPSDARPAGAAAPAPRPTDGGADASLAVPDVDLLHWTPAFVAVDSNVKNPRDYPEHLVDGKPETAWNGATGRLVGSEIAFRVPAGTRLKRIEMSAGFEKAGPKGDFFTMNHRIARVQVLALSRKGPRDDSFDEIVVGEYPFDTNDRRPQPITLDRPGGLYVVRVMEVVPGTKQEWRELVVSELRVIGDAGASRLEKARMPRVVIGKAADIADAVLPPPQQPLDLTSDLPLAAASTKDLCSAWDAKVAPLFASHYQMDIHPGSPEPPHCRPGPVVKLPESQRVKAVSTVTLNVMDAVEEHLLIETDRGVVVPRDALLREQAIAYAATKTTAKIVAARIEGADLVASIAYSARYEFWCVGSGDEPTRWQNDTVDFDLRCNMDTAPISCVRLERRRSCKGECSSYQ